MVIDADLVRSLSDKKEMTKNKVGGILRAIVFIKVDGRQIVERLPFRVGRNKAYIWGDVVGKIDVEIVLDEMIKKYERHIKN